MTLATVTNISSRRPAARTDPAPTPVIPNAVPAADPERRCGVVYPRLRTRGGRIEYLTEWGRAYRIGGRWFVGSPARQVTVPATVAALDANELRQL